MSVSNPGGGISGKGGSFWTAAIGASVGSTKLEADIGEWNYLDEVDSLDSTNFNSRDAGDTTVAVVDKVAGLDSFTITCKGKIGSYTAIAALRAGGFIQVYLGAVGGATMSGVAATDIAAGKLGYGPFACKVSKSNFTNQVTGTADFEATLVSVSSRAVTA